MDYVFVIGRNWELSVLELFSYLKSRKIKHEVFDVLDDYVRLDVDIKPSKVIKELAGTMKIGQLIAKFPKGSEIDTSILDRVVLYFGKKKSISVGIDAYDCDKDFVLLIKDYVQQRMKEEKLKATFKWPRRGGAGVFSLLPSDTIKIIKEGFELVLIEDEKNFCVYNVVAAFDPHDFEFRDKSRPIQRPLHTISIRLAKIMINLAGAKAGDWLLDPFCGIGTILQEALLMGIEAVGMDSSKEVISFARKNLEWINKTYKPKLKYDLIYGDAKHLTKYVKENSINAVVSEPYLGPFIKSLPNIEIAKETMAELTEMYATVIAKISRVLVKGGTVAIIVPRLVASGGRTVSMPFEQLLVGSGLSVFSMQEQIKIPILYAEERHKIERLIYVLKKE